MEETTTTTTIGARTESTSAKTLADIEADNEKALQQFMIVVWKPNPVTHSIEVYIDDGSIRFFMKDEKFVAQLEAVLMDSCTAETYKNITRIKNSMFEYGGVFYYDRGKDFFTELTSVEDIEKLRQTDILKAEQDKMKPATLFDTVSTDTTVEEIVTTNRKVADKKMKGDFLHAVLRTIGYGSFTKRKR